MSTRAGMLAVAVTLVTLLGCDRQEAQEAATVAVEDARARSTTPAAAEPHADRTAISAAPEIVVYKAPT